MLCYEVPIDLGTWKPCDMTQVHTLDVCVAVLRLDDY